jgi:putative PIN family toxin of toxin-antitoxin system
VRLVLDTNIFVSALIGPGTPARILESCWTGDPELVISEPILDELSDVLARDRIVRRLARRGPEVSEFVARLRQSAVIVDPTETLDLCDDPDDNRILEAANAGGADYIVTCDDDLLRLAEVQGTRIVTPAQFLAEITTRR